MSSQERMGTGPKHYFQKVLDCHVPAYGVDKNHQGLPLRLGQVFLDDYLKLAASEQRDLANALRLIPFTL
jgi:hypothetical protein